MSIDLREEDMVGLAADFVLLNGKVVTVDPKDTIAEAVAACMHLEDSYLVD